MSAYASIRIHDESRLSAKSIKAALGDSRQTGFEIRLALAAVLGATLCKILMKIDCFDKDNDVGNNNVSIYRCGAGDASIWIGNACERNGRGHTMS